MQLRRYAWLIWFIGTVFILLSWMRVVTPGIGWAGFFFALAASAMSWLPSQWPYPLAPEQIPVSPSGVAVDRDMPLNAGTRVLAYSQGYWWRARVLGIEDGDLVRVEFSGWDPSLQYCVPRSHLQVDLTWSAQME